MAKKKTTKRESTYLREIEVKYKRKRVTAEAPAGEYAADPSKVADLFSDLQDEAKEKLVAISVDAKLKIIAFEVVSIGSPTAVYAQPFECARTPILVGASGMIMVHNHPSGDPSPSEPDKDFTWQLLRVCLNGGIPLHDHIIIGDGNFYSFANEGWIEKYRAKAEKEIVARPKR